MKKIKFKILFIFLTIICLGVNGQNRFTEPNYVTYTPLDQSISTPSGVEVTANVRINCYGKQPDTRRWEITAQFLPEGYLIHSPGIEFLRSDENDIVEFRFKLETSQTGTLLYEFKAEWYPDGGGSNPDEEDITIEVTYIAESCSLSPPGSLTTSNITSNSAQ